MPTLFAFNDLRAGTTARRQQVLNEGAGRFAETFPFPAATSSNIQTSGTVYFTPIGLLGGDVVTSIQVGVATAGATFSGIGSKVGIYSAAGASATLVASSGDVSASVSSTGVKSLAVSLQSNNQPFVVPADGAYYIAWLTIATTPPVGLRSAVGSANTLGLVSGATVGYGGSQAGQTDLPATATIAFNSQSVYWFGVA